MTPGPVRRTQEGMSNQNRVQAGVPSGGEYAAHTFPEATGVALADPAGRLIVLAPGEDENYNELADGDVIETINVRRGEDATGYIVSASKTLNIRGLFDEKDFAADGGLDTYLERHDAQIEDFIRERYDADLDNQDWEEVTVECGTTLQDGPLTERGIADAAWNSTKITALHNESDPGTFGSEFLGRLIREQIAGSASVENRLAARAVAMRMLPADIEEHVRDRARRGLGLSDAAALAVAGRLKDPSRPALSRLAVRGYANRDDLTTELNLVWLQNSVTAARSSSTAAALDMMHAWVRNGDNA
jgi:hypothetical protein